MEEVVKVLGPWPVLQFMFGLAVLGTGIWAIIRGTHKREETPQLEDRRAEWEALQLIRDIREEETKQTEILRHISGQMNSNAEAMRALAAALHNESQWRKQR